MDLAKIGRKLSDIPVIINPRIIELFSAGLYSSPNKAFEELICNSYDAYADKVSVYISTEGNKETDIIWVCDNGEGMDSAGLRQLWKIGDSNKRKGEKSTDKRLQIGKFGIGKLATFIMANKLTYICKVKGLYKSVTMDYGCLNTTKYESKGINLEERELTEDQVIELLESLVEIDDINMVNFKLWGRNSEDSWTVALLTELKDKAYEISKRKLEWLLKTALPLNPGFKLFLNGLEIKSKKLDITPWRSWIIGENDETVEKNPKLYTSSTINGKPCINTKSVKNITGRIDLYKETLVRKDKSQKLGRSNGIFIMVRGRLVNVSDALFGMEPMSHGVFNRIRIIVNADELDKKLASTREAIQESTEVREVRKYINQKFNQISAYYYNIVKIEEKERLASSKIAVTSTSLSRKPLISIARKFFKNELEPLYLTTIPEITDETQQFEFLSKLENDLISEQGIIKEIIWKDLEPHQPMANLDLLTGKVFINAYHPFISNFITEMKKTLLPFELIAIVEILTEAYMLEEDINQSLVESILKKRDKLFRELAYKDFIPNIFNVSKLLEDSLADPDGLEDALVYVFRLLGFDTEKLGQSGKPDGIAKATLGVRSSGGSKEDYTVIFDAKSTGKKSIKASTIGFSAIDEHRDENNANYAVVVAIDFQGADNENSRANKGAEKNDISLIRAKDLLCLLLIAGPKQITLSMLKDFFKNNHSVIKTSAWINKMKNRVVKPQPIKEVLNTAFDLMKNDSEPPTIDAIRHSSKMLKKDYSREDLISVVSSLEKLIPRYISLGENEIVYIEHNPDIIMNSLTDVITNYAPPELRKIYAKNYDIT